MLRRRSLVRAFRAAAFAVVTSAALAVAFVGCSQGASPIGSGPAAPAATTNPASPVQPVASAAPTSVAKTVPKACDLLSDADILELGGVAVVSKQDDVLDTIYVNHCRWTLEVGEINLGIVTPDGREFYDTRLGIINGLEPVDGLPADIATRQDLTGTIFAVKGDTLVDLFTIAVGAPDEELVRRILANLGA